MKFDFDEPGSTPSVTPLRADPISKDKDVSLSVVEHTETRIRDATKRQFNPWVTILASTTIFFAVLWIRAITGGGPGPGPEPGPGPTPAGSYVGIFYNDADVGKYTQGQRDFLNSAAVAGYLEKHATNWKKLDVDESVAGLDPVFQEMADQHKTSLPWMVIRNGKRFSSESIVNADQSLALLKKWLE